MLDPFIQRLFEEQDEKGGIDTRKLPAGTKFLVRTSHNEYTIENVDQSGKAVIQGGHYFPEPVVGFFSGSTFGGSMLRIGWIGHLMHMEFWHPHRRQVVTTSMVQSAKIVGPTWQYEMEWADGPEGIGGSTGK